MADLGGSMRLLLSLNPRLARQYRLDGVYALAPSDGNPLQCTVSPGACVKRWYGSEPYLCTFTYPGDWAQDPSVAFAQQEPTVLSSRSPRRPTAKNLPLVAVGPAGGGAASGGLSVALYSRRTKAASLAEALGSPEQALSDVMGRFTSQAPKLQ